MTEDARFEDGAATPLRLKALDAEDLAVISAAVQDAVFPITEMRWQKAARRFGLLLNRFRWEDAGAAQRAGRPVERVQCVLAFEDVQQIATQGIDRTEKDTVLSVLSVTFEETGDSAGHVMITLAGDGAIRLQTEALEATLRDVTRPYQAVSGRVPSHGD